MRFLHFNKAREWMARGLLLLFLLGGCAAPSVNTSSGPSLSKGEVAESPSLAPEASFSEEKSSSFSQSGGAQIDPADPTAFSARSEGDGGTVAVWWWDKGKAVASKRGEYLDFLEKNRVNEIYICWPNFQKRQLADFVKAAGKRGMAVSLLSGDASWIDPQNEGAKKVVEEFLDYQSSALPEERLSSLHMDVEPHQRTDFYTEQEKILQWYGDFVQKTAENVRAQGEKIGWDIPFWFDDFKVLDGQGEALPLLDHLAKNADTLCLMSYRDSAKEVLACAERELVLEGQYGCQIICGVETYSMEGDHVSFMEEGKTFMAEETGKLYLELQQRLPRGKYGIAVHYLDTWLALKE